MGGCCAALTGMRALPLSFRMELAPENTRFCRRLRVGCAAPAGCLAEFHVTWVGADDRGLYISILGDSALVPWSEVSKDDLSSSYEWVHLRWAHVDLRLPHAVFVAIVEPVMPRHSEQYSLLGGSASSFARSSLTVRPRESAPYAGRCSLADGTCSSGAGQCCELHVASTTTQTRSSLACGNVASSRNSGGTDVVECG
jgi:hypothetical protein